MKPPPANPSRTNQVAAGRPEVLQLVWAAWQLQQQGKRDEARLKYLRALELEPSHPDALHMLGMLAHQGGDAALAVEYFDKSLASAPGNADALSNQGLALKDLGRLDDALRCFDRALALKPDSAGVHLNRGITLKALGRAEDALASYDRALAIDPNLAVGHYNRGIALQEAERFDEALACYSRAIALRPGHAPAIANRGYVLRMLGENEPALADYDRALALRPDCAEYHSGRGVVLKNLKRFDEAIACQDRAIALRPAYAEAHVSRGLAQQELGRTAEALAECDQAIILAPELAAAHSARGMILQQSQRPGDAVASYVKAIELDPKLGFAQSSAIHLHSQLIDWPALDRDMEALPALMSTDMPGFAPFTLLALPGVDAQTQKLAAERYAANSLKGLRDAPLVDPATWRPRTRLRIGYLSADIYGHATVFLLAGVLEAHNRNQVEVWMYSYGKSVNDPSRQRIIAACEHFLDIDPLSDSDAARQIARDDIDILVDLKGYTKDYRIGITARRPSPVIVSWLGYPGTLGDRRLADYILGDPTVTPLACAAEFSEALALMPHCYQPNDSRRPLGQPPTRDAAGLPGDGFVFCSFNQTYKIHRPTFSLWCRLLATIPGSVMWLLTPLDDVARTRLRAEAAQHEIDPDRLVFAPLVPLPDHLARLQLADLALDTFPYTSHTTGSDALWAGVPLITRTGDTFASRVAASLLRAAGLPELVAASEEDYFALASELASNQARLAQIRGRLTKSRVDAPLFDTARFARNLERMYREMWSRQESGSKGTIMLADPPVDSA